ncbi:M23 peptidase domain-containing protein [Arthrobacter crystallopoietes BAB-32]|uniref:M23 peptidase domain-containing protein n=1 Tax=Arthrobacter crystallopoietes BAB-32 TaxID=1246476 RepID=N1UWQ4_9MICC|nr:M23 family metallopeptidase [Arthrobacter crystallopoietes]EMY34801.1 M23 peptidase domain-containing protein [Arthrobacter crystallopoietes BAB-32]
MNNKTPMRGRRRSTDTSLLATVRGNGTEGRRRADDNGTGHSFFATRSQKFGIALATTGILALAAVPTAQAGAEQLGTTQAASVSPAAVTAPEDAAADFTRVEVSSKPAPEKTGMEAAAASVKDEAKSEAAAKKAEEAKAKKAAEQKASNEGLVSPVQEMVTSSGFGYRINPVTGAAGEFHNGLDFALECGTPVTAAAAGTVEETSSSAGGYGNRVVIKHADGMTTTYNHLQSIGVSQGAKVSAGDNIASLGTTGNSTGCHLHFEVQIDGDDVDPAKYL